MGASTRRLFGAIEDASDLAVGQVGRDPQEHGRPLFVRQGSERRPGVALVGHVGCPVLWRLGDREGPAPARPALVYRLMASDRERPRPQVRARREVRVGPQCREAGLLEAVLGLLRADERDKKAHELGGVAVEEGLERRQGHNREDV